MPLAADLTDGRTDGRCRVSGLRRALAALPEGVAEVKVRVDAGYLAGDLALECLAQGVRFAIGAKRSHSCGRTRLGCTEPARDSLRRSGRIAGPGLVLAARVTRR